ncbi:hypothetical protein, partial [Rhizobium sophoriradicis]|uniref:hypothetical protein n=1 Tax=Rhizobium sophoriradicis TaxID=1535245 RepID=UPI001AED02B5
LRRQQRRRPRSVSGLIEPTPFPSQQRFSKKIIFLAWHCFCRRNFDLRSDAIVPRIPTGLTAQEK